MAPAIHPPCTPTASCAPSRCHPTPPPCATPEKCLEKSKKKGSKPCPSAVSIMATKATAKCSECSKCGGRKDGKAGKGAIEKYLATKKKEQQLIETDRKTGSHKYADYLKKKYKAPTKKEAEATPCCQGKGHRGPVVKRSKKRACTIL